MFCERLPAIPSSRSLFLCSHVATNSMKQSLSNEKQYLDLSRFRGVFREDDKAYFTNHFLFAVTQ